MRVANQRRIGMIESPTTVRSMATRLVGLFGAVLICSGVAHAVECRIETVGGTSFTACRVDLNSEQLDLFWRDTAGRPYRQFSVLRDTLEKQGKKLLLAVNAGMY